jgi:cell wall-associated NlpC family hydrolase
LLARKKKKDKPKTKVTFVSRGKDSVLQKATPFDLDIAIESKRDIDKLLDFAKDQLGTPYKYASADPKKGGLDCSGFVFYVFQHFKVTVPRSSRDYMNFGKTVDENDARKGDVIVFTGTNAKQRTGGHVGIILDTKKHDITFIHGSSGRSQGVIISKLSDGYYTQRFLKIVRVIN